MVLDLLEDVHCLLFLKLLLLLVVELEELSIKGGQVVCGRLLFGVDDSGIMTTFLGLFLGLQPNLFDRLIL